MNLESLPRNKATIPAVEDVSMDDFDFKPITSGLGFHHAKAAEVKPAFTDKVVNRPVAPARKEMSVYQNDLSLFYGGAQAQAPVLAPVESLLPEERAEKVYLLATKTQRSVAYVMDLLVLGAVVGIVLTVMARMIHMDLMEVWTAFPHEITPLVLVLFAGFYVIYFSVFEKAPGSTLGKNVFGLRVVNLDNGPQSFTTLFGRSVITLANFLSLGLFAWFDLQNKVTQSKVIRMN